MHEQNESSKTSMQFSCRVKHFERLIADLVSSYSIVNSAQHSKSRVQNVKKSKNFSTKLMKLKTAGTASSLKELNELVHINSQQHGLC